MRGEVETGLSFAPPALTRVDEEIARCRKALDPLRAAHVTAVKAAIKGPVREQTARALEALATAEAAVKAINKHRAAVRAACGGEEDIPLRQLLITQMILRDIARK